MRVFCEVLQMIKGLIAPILSPFNDDLSFNKSLYSELAKELINNGCAGLAPFGTTGEALSLTVSERMSALEELIKSGINPKMIIPGTGLCNLEDTKVLSKHAVDLGCAGVMTLPPFYFKGLGDKGYFEYFERLIANINNNELKIYLYHIPQVSGVGLSIDLVTKLRTAYPENVVGIKDSSGDWENTKKLLQIDGLIVYPGAELSVLESIRLGGPGCISATANINSAEISKLIDLCHGGEWEAAGSAQKNVNAVRMLFQDYAPIPAQKALVAKRNNEPRWNNLRPPLIALEHNQREILEDNLARYGLFF